MNEATAATPTTDGSISKTTRSVRAVSFTHIRNPISLSLSTCSDTHALTPTVVSALAAPVRRGF